MTKIVKTLTNITSNSGTTQMQSPINGTLSYVY